MKLPSTKDPIVHAPARILGRDGLFAVRVADGTLAGVMPAFMPALGPERMWVPLFTDAHLHMGLWATFLASVDLRGLDSTQDCAHALKAHVTRSEGGRWIRGRGFDINRFAPGDAPSAEVLDAFAPDHPVWFAAHDEHAAWVNTRTLLAAGIGPDTPDPYGGKIMRDAKGRATGYLLETAMDLVRRVLPQRTLEMWKDDLLIAEDDLLARGLALVQDVDPDTEEGLRALDDEGKLRLRVATAIPSRELRRAIREGRRTGDGTPHLRLGGVKWFVDGSLGSRTAAMKAPWSDRPDSTGTWLIPEERLIEELTLARDAGLRPLIHAIGDAAVERVIRALTRLGPWPLEIRPRVEHAQTIADADLSAFAASGAVASMQPCHLLTDRPIAPRALGPRARTLFRCRSLLSRGVPVLLGTDAPVEPPNPLTSVHVAMHRTAPSDPMGAPFHPEECLTETEAFRASTLLCAADLGFPEAAPSLLEGSPMRWLLLERPAPKAPWEIVWRPDPRATSTNGYS